MATWKSRTARRSPCANRRWRCSSTRPGGRRVSARHLQAHHADAAGLTYLKNWDNKLFESPFKSDVYFFSTRQQIDQKWGTPQPITVRDADFGAVRLRAFGNFASASAIPKLFTPRFPAPATPTPFRTSTASCVALVLQNISNAIAASGIPFLDLAANQLKFAEALSTQLAPEFAAKIGLKLEGMTVQNVSLPEELQKILDQKIGMGMVGNDTGKFMQYQTAQAIPKFAEGCGGGGGGIAGDAMGLGAGVRWARCWRRTWPPACRAHGRCGRPRPSRPGCRGAARRRDGHAGKLGELKTKGILTRKSSTPRSRAAEKAGLNHPVGPDFIAARGLRHRAKAVLPLKTGPSAVSASRQAPWLTRHHPAPLPAPCPGCGAPVEFRSASTHAVCGYCQSTVVRQGEVLSRIWARWPSCSTTTACCSSWPVASLVDGQGFTLVGPCFKNDTGEGAWTEWQALLADGGAGFLSEDNGAYVFSRP